MASTLCTACGGESAPEPFYHEWRDRRWRIRRCRDCTHQFVHPPVGPEEQAIMYDDAYFSTNGDWVCGLLGGRGYKDAEDDLVTEAHEILALIDRDAGALLDIGCAGGTFLDVARSEGFRVQGIEINESMAEHARDTYGLDVLRSRIEDVAADTWSAEFDVVTLLDVLEHMPAPLDTVRKVARWIRPGGSLLIRGPMSNSRLAHTKEWLRRIVGMTKRLPGYPLDANRFNRRSMTAMFRASGFEWVRWWPTESFANVLAHRTSAIT